MNRLLLPVWMSRDHAIGRGMGTGDDIVGLADKIGEQRAGDIAPSFTARGIVVFGGKHTAKTSILYQRSYNLADEASDNHVLFVCDKSKIYEKKPLMFRNEQGYEEAHKPNVQRRINMKYVQNREELIELFAKLHEETKPISGVFIDDLDIICRKSKDGRDSGSYVNVVALQSTALALLKNACESLACKYAIDVCYGLTLTSDNFNQLQQSMFRLRLWVSSFFYIEQGKDRRCVVSCVVPGWKSMKPPTLSSGFTLVTPDPAAPHKYLVATN